MNKFLITLNSVLAIAVIVLFVLVFSDKNSGKAENTEIKTETNVSDNESKIAFINLDTLVSSYQRSLDLQKDLQKKVNTIQSDIEKKARALENDATDLENRMKKGTITSFEANDVRNSLIQRDQDLQVYTAQKQREMAEEEQVMVNKIMDDIKTCVEKYQQEFNYSLILTTSAATNTVMAYDKNLDITSNILERLNSQYAKK